MLALLGPFTSLRFVSALRASFRCRCRSPLRCLSPTSLRSSGAAGSSLLRVVLHACSGVCLPSRRLPAWCRARAGQGQLRLRRAPASDREGVRCCLAVVLLVGWGPVGGLSLPGPLRANQEPARRRKRRMAPEGGGVALRRTCACGGTLVRGTCPARTDPQPPRTPVRCAQPTRPAVPGPPGPVEFHPEPHTLHARPPT